MDNLFSVVEVAGVTGLKRNEIKKLCESKQIKAERIGSEWVIREESLNAYLQQHSIPSKITNQAEVTKIMDELIEQGYTEFAVNRDVSGRWIVYANTKEEVK
jgi:excisionase family DNA binding protein